MIDFQSRNYENNFAWHDSRAYFGSDLVVSNNKFDVVVNYFIGEKLGLGRYGEEVWIDADLATMDQVKCMLRPGGLALIGITTNKDTTSDDDEGYVVNNVGRVYGEKRVNKLLTGWNILGEKIFNFGSSKIYVLQKPIEINLNI